MWNMRAGVGAVTAAGLLSFVAIGLPCPAGGCRDDRFRVFPNQ